IVEAWQQDVATRYGFVDLASRRVEIPETEPQVGVVGNARAALACGLYGGVAGSAGGLADRLADRRHVEEPGAGNVVARQRVRRHQGGRRVLAQIVELVTGRRVRDEADAGRRRGMARDL